VTRKDVIAAILAEQFLLNEEGTIIDKKKGLGFELIVHSREHDPPHAHIINLNRVDLGRVIISSEFPKSIEIIGKDFISPKFKKNLLEYLTEFPGEWIRIKEEWNRLNPKLTQLSIKGSN
jgi:hypothetical protein